MQKEAEELQESWGQGVLQRPRRAVGWTGRERGEALVGEHGGAPDTLQAS